MQMSVNAAWTNQRWIQPLGVIGRHDEDMAFLRGQPVNGIE
jgi:hypothetical protein